MQFISVNPDNPAHLALLYDLLRERTPEESISHKEMPTFVEHVDFVESSPYQRWVMLLVDGRLVGASYLTHENEIGVSVLARERGNGYGSQAVEGWIARYPGRKFLANINPKNGKSQALFKKLGFRHIQNTYAREP